MLDGLRGFAKSWPGKIMGAFLLVGVAGFGINNVITDLGSNTVAHVGDQEITSREFLRAYQSQANRLAQQLGRVPTGAEAEAMGLPSFVILNLAQGEALTGLANKMGLGVSDDKLGQMLRQDPSFQGTLGNFDPAVFNQVLQASGWTESEYFQTRGDEAKREQLVSTLFPAKTLPDVAATLINDYAGTQRTIDYVTLNEANIETPAAPTEEELAAYLTEHQSEFRTVETRKVQMIDLSIASLAATKTIADDAVAAEYERIKASLTTPEKRTIEQAVLTADQATAFEAGLAAGKDFATLTTEAGVTPTSLGTLTKAQVMDTALANAAFGLQQGGVTVIDGVAGKRAIHVSAIEAERQPTLEEARADIVNTLATAEARTEVNDVLDQVEELRAAFRPLSEIAERFKLPLYEADVTSGGNQLDVLTNVSPEDRTKVSQAIFKATAGQLTPSIPITGNAHVFFDLVEVQAARDQTLDEVRDAVTTALTTERINNALLAKSEEIVAQLRGGATLADVATGLNLFPQISPPFSRFGSDDGSIDNVVAQAAFNGGPDYKGSVVSSSGDFMIFEVVDNTTPTEPLETAAADNLQTEAQNGVYGDFVAALRDDAGLKINQQALQQLITLNFGQ
ncbi:SurA N-terminal domain-containing protein [Devosia sp. BK]|uniref:SurA N-terminal domain-containing protein n=1 Tax=Devosia sp. BK TaxID=2871706 RepID=UPI00293A2927|nr:SurA N-terminal domain-containing protein [Devosia sp. BK]MDV3250887.1 SurA N-terminal domain-containing protein [Devosia sp. BK]